MPRIEATDAMPLLAKVASGTTLGAADMRTAARFALQELAERHPGRSVEVRVPYVGAVQIVEGLRHRRGTPPNVVEMSAEVFLAVTCGTRSWHDAVAAGDVSASGTRSDLSEFFPIVTPQALARWE